MTQNRQDTPRKILVTGCASGIGLAQAKCFLESGDKVYGVDKQTPQAFSHPNFFFFKADLTGDLTDLLAQLPQTFDVICHTAGILDDYKPLLETSDEDFRQLWLLISRL